MVRNMGGTKSPWNAFVNNSSKFIPLPSLSHMSFPWAFKRLTKYPGSLQISADKTSAAVYNKKSNLMNVITPILPSIVGREE